MGAKVPTWLIKLLKSSANIVEAAGGKAAEPEYGETEKRDYLDGDTETVASRFVRPEQNE